MTPSEVVTRMAGAWNSGDRAAYMGTAHPDVAIDPGQFSERHGETAWAGDYDLLHTAFPDIKLEALTTIDQGDWCSGEIMVTGTHTGPLQFPEGFPIREIAPTGKSISVRYGAFARVVNDRIVEESTYGYLGPLLQQLGVKVKYEAGAPA